MHGLIHRSVQSFLRDTYGADLWQSVAAAADAPLDGFEAMLTYDADQLTRLIDAASTALDKAPETLLEDLGTYLVSHPNVAALRRLLRFGGESFADFLNSLPDLHDRGRLAVADLDLPMIEVMAHGGDTYTVRIVHEFQGFGRVALGILRAMADDYGTLVFLEFRGRQQDVETLFIEVVATDFHEGREFSLASAG